jgi:hypothetical protein
MDDVASKQQTTALVLSHAQEDTELTNKQTNKKTNKQTN